jgi:hypothetical protein
MSKKLVMLKEIFVLPMPETLDGLKNSTGNTQNYWVFGLFSSYGILETRKHDV